MRLKIIIGLVAVLITASLAWVYFKDELASTPRVLVFSKTAGYHHSSIPLGIKAIQKIGLEKGFIVDTTTDARIFKDKKLKKYQAVIFNNTTGNVLNGEQQAAFERYIQAGGGFVGIHAAADTEYDWAWYNNLLGAQLASHPHNPNIREAMIEVLDKNHPSTSSLPTQWKRTDEWYNYKSLYSGIKILANLDETTYEGGINGSSHPISWYHEYDGGRAFYTGNGHIDESYNESDFLDHLTGGIIYAMGDGKKLDYTKAYSKVTPEQNRFVKTVLKDKLNAPMELAVTNDGRVLFTELYGNLSVFDTRTGKYDLIHAFPITDRGGTGLIGITTDPDFDNNQFIYLYYSPIGQDGDLIEFQLSRFILDKNNILDLASEKVLLKVPVQGNSGSHHGGSLAWDKEGNLYLSTGDSTSPFYSNGYAPLDERPGKEYYSLDSQRGAGSTNDLKGKVLRIHPELDGTYTIPEGNLFPEGTAKTKPEIYVMGARNPYRIAVNPKSSVLYWGDIGPDAGEDGIQGPRGYDELNQTRSAGNYGWPYFIGNNFAYADWDFATKTAGPLFNAESPVNNSPNNTGLTNLPPAKPAMIWYPYSASEEFPELGEGGRCVVVGTFYSFNKSSNSNNKFPDYYDGSLFVADWMRNWVRVLVFDKDENYLRSEPFMPINGDFKRPIDMAFGKDGTMYMLEYGSVYGVANADARLVKIEYNTGNRKPIAKANVTDLAMKKLLDTTKYLTSELKEFPSIKEISGQSPLTVSFNSLGTKDLDDDDKLSYQWLFDGKAVGATTPDATYTYTQAGVYPAVLKVTDRDGLSAYDTVTVRVGNTVPKVEITSDNRSFFWENKPFSYEVKVSDQEDKLINEKNLKVFYTYNPQPVNLSRPGLNVGDGEEFKGHALIASSDCQSCHILDQKAVGPSWREVSKRYKTQSGALDFLANKIIKGGGGSWGNTYVMSAHPQISLDEAKEIVKYIFSVTDTKKGSSEDLIPIKGKLPFKVNTDNPQGHYIVEAAYTDNGGQAVEPLTGKDKIIVRNPNVSTVFADAHVGFSRFRDNLSPGGNKAYILLKNIDLTNIKQFVYRYSSKDMEGKIEVRMNSLAGPVISTVAFNSTGSWDEFKALTGKLSNAISGEHDLYFIAMKPSKPNNSIINLSHIRFEN